MFYFMHNLSKIGDYLNYLIDLDERSCFHGGMEKLPTDLNELLTVEGSNGTQDLVDTDEIEYSIIENWLQEIRDETDIDTTIQKVRINRQLNIWSARTRSKGRNPCSPDPRASHRCRQRRNRC